MKEIVLVAALSENHAIGKDNQLLWHLPEDLKRFRAMTLGHTVVMGRKTFDSIGKPLPKRKNVILTRNTDWSHPEVSVYNDMEKAIAACADETLMILVAPRSMPRACLLPTGSSSHMYTAISRVMRTSLISTTTFGKQNTGKERPMLRRASATLFPNGSGNSLEFAQGHLAQLGRHIVEVEDQGFLLPRLKEVRTWRH